MRRVIEPGSSADWLALTGEPIRLERALEWASGPAWGGVVGFSGVVRESAEGRRDVSAIDYEAYEAQVLGRFEQIAAMARREWPELGRLVIWHRTGRVETGESSVVTVASAPHRAEAFEACRFLIDTLKSTVPIWKREHWSGGSDWSPAAHPIRPVGGSAELP